MTYAHRPFSDLSEIRNPRPIVSVPKRLISDPIQVSRPRFINLAPKQMARMLPLHELHFLPAIGLIVEPFNNIKVAFKSLATLQHPLFISHHRTLNPAESTNMNHNATEWLSMKSKIFIQTSWSITHLPSVRRGLCRHDLFQ